MTRRTGRGMNESAFTRWFCAALERVNALTIPLVGSTMQRSGLPDRYVCHRRFRGWLEFKKAEGKLRGEQRTTIRELVARGDAAFVVRVRSGWVAAETWDGVPLAGMLDVAALPADLRERGLAQLAWLEEVREALQKLERTNG